MHLTRRSREPKRAAGCRSGIRHLVVFAAPILAACGGEATRTTHAPRTPAQTAPPHAEVAQPSAGTEAQGAASVTKPAPVPFAGFAHDQTFFIVEVDHGKARCQPWTYTAAAKTLTATRGAVTDTFRVQVNASTIELGALTRRGADVDASTTCERTFDLAEASQAIVVGRAPWFTDAAACETAVRERRRVAMDFGCELEVEVPERVVEATRTRFHRLLARGGTAYSIVEGPRGDTCKAVRVRPHRRGKGAPVEGNFHWSVVSDEGLKGTEFLGYRLEPWPADKPREGMNAGLDELFLLGPTTKWADGSSDSLGCAGGGAIDYGDDYVMVGDGLYLTQKACRAAIAKEAARLAWYPREGDAPSGTRARTMAAWPWRPRAPRRSGGGAERAEASPASPIVLAADRPFA